MSYVPNLLSINGKGKHAECWLAATLSERMLKRKISNKKILQVNIADACKEILKLLNDNSQNPQKRLSLHVAATLTFGVVRMQLYKVDLVEKSLTAILHDPVTPDVGGAGKKKITCDDPVLAIDLRTDFDIDVTLPEPPLFDIDVLNVAEDVNRLHELSPRHYRQNQEADIQSPTHFGPLSGEEIDAWLNILEADDIFGRGDSEHRPASPPPPTDDIPVHQVHASSIVGQAGRKRPSTDDIPDKSAKRPRLMQPVADRGSEAPSAVLQSIHEKSDQPNLPSTHEANVPPADSPILPVQEVAVSDLPADFNAPQQDKKKATRKPRTRGVDKTTTIAVGRRHFTNCEAHTLLPSAVIALARHKLEVPLSVMLQYPSETFKFGTNRPPFVRQRLFCVDLIHRFETAISAPKKTSSEATATISQINILVDSRKKHATIEPITATIENITGTKVTRKDNTAPEAVASDAAQPVVGSQEGIMNEHGFEAQSEEPLTLVEVTDEGIPDNTRSEETERKWTKENLIECLSTVWRECSAVPFKKLNPSGEKKINSAACFSFLLELSKEKKVYLEQREQIYIKKGSSDNEHEVDD